MPLNRQLPRIDASQFSMVPRADIPRSTFATEHSLKSTFHSQYLIPIFVDEVLPGDVHQGQVTIFARLATPIFPIMDAMTLETFFFFVPCRLVWANWKKFMGERANPADSISYTIPIVNSASGPSGHFPILSLFDYFGLPCAGQLGAGEAIQVNALPLRGYNLIWNEWFRDQNLQNSKTVTTGDGPDTYGDYVLLKRNKKHDYFTSALPWPLKGGVEVTIPMSGNAPVRGIAVSSAINPVDGHPSYYETGGVLTTSAWVSHYKAETANSVAIRGLDVNANVLGPSIYADMSSIAGQTINALRLLFQTQRLLERDARSGTRYTELLRAHFGVTPEDSRLQRPEYIGGGKTDIQTQAIPQTSSSGITGSTGVLGSLGAAATASDQHRFSYHATEHGYIIGLAHATGEVTYQQGLHRMWTRATRYDFYWPVFAHLGEQIIRQDELYCTGNDSADTAAFGYQERWAEYRHRPSRVTGLFKSRSAGTIDPWHLSQNFATPPALNSTFIEDSVPLARALAAGAAADNMQILFDSVFRIRTTRAMPMFSVPGMIDRF